MIKREAQFQRVFGHWLQYAYTGPSAVFELKRTLTNRLPFSEIKKHQIEALVQVKDGFYHKLPDDTIAKKPFDCIWLRQMPAYVAIAFGKRLTGFYLLPVEEAVDMKFRARGSITEEDCQVRKAQYVAISSKGGS